MAGKGWGIIHKMDNLKHDLNDIKIRILNADEFNRSDLVEIFRKNESLVPNPLITNIQIAEDENGKIIGLVVLQPQYHAEPIYVADEYKHTKLHVKLIEAMLNPFKEVKGLRIWIFSPNSKIARLALRFGFAFKDYEVFVKEF